MAGREFRGWCVDMRKAFFIGFTSLGLSLSPISPAKQCSPESTSPVHLSVGVSHGGGDRVHFTDKGSEAQEPGPQLLVAELRV